MRACSRPFRPRAPGRRLHPEAELACRAHVRHTPVEPKPNVSRSVVSSSSTSCHSTCSTRWITSCAMRSPRSTVIGSARIGVHEQHLELAAVQRVDEPGRVEARDAVTSTRARSGAARTRRSPTGSPPRARWARARAHRRRRARPPRGRGGRSRRRRCAAAAAAAARDRAAGPGSRTASVREVAGELGALRVGELHPHLVLRMVDDEPRRARRELRALLRRRTGSSR